LATTSYNFLGVAFYENFTYELCFPKRGFWEVMWAVECFGESNVLLCYNPARYALFLFSKVYVMPIKYIQSVISYS
jgi:hypothetical protein